ncbi:uncharacterized protein LOC133900987 [Phragmites australis]|uniref:uncharacterized protein LOC133900987 n=1 Tax=Phragmites australis TaxID=29695 RepID=UPI002D78565A|nr:uncharacterized protein LOC133900987 [Phragmites australis]
MISDHSASVVCLMETKLDVINQLLVNEICGLGFSGYPFLLASETRGGVFVACHQPLSLVVVQVSQFLVSGRVCTDSGASFFLTAVYGPTDESLKDAFLDEIKNVRSLWLGPWLIIGDFNMISSSADKNNNRLNRRSMSRFCNFINDLELQDLHLFGQHYTWSNERASPTLERLDRALVSSDWDAEFLDSFLQALSLDCSDHCPLLLSTSMYTVKQWRFHFESIWIKMPGFLSVVQRGWRLKSGELSLPPLRQLHVLLRRTALELQRWSSRHIGNIKDQLLMARENHISSLATAEGPVSSHLEMEETLFSHFSSILGIAPPHDFSINLHELGIAPLDLQALDAPFSVAEILGAIRRTPLNKAPEPDGFSTEFYQATWPVISNDMTMAICAFAMGDRRGLDHLNTAFITLIPKKEGAMSLSDYRPISLIHSIDKIITKTLALRLAPRLNSLIMNCQSAFISRRSIHNNFKLVHSTARLLKKSKKPKVPFKLDISKAFDLQGDLLSPFLFVLVMDTLASIFWKAGEAGIVDSMGHSSIVHHFSLYADDVVLFMSPTSRDIQAHLAIIQFFGAVSGLKTNLDKCAAIPICCSESDVSAICENLTCGLSSFPIQYLGVPLTVGRLRKNHLQPLVDKVYSRTRSTGCTSPTTEPGQPADCQGLGSSPRSAVTGLARVMQLAESDMACKVGTPAKTQGVAPPSRSGAAHSAQHVALAAGKMEASKTAAAGAFLTLDMERCSGIHLASRRLELLALPQTHCKLQGQRSRRVTWGRMREHGANT